MAKPTTYATPICIVLSILAIVGIALGVWMKNPLITILLLLPSVAYEAYRTEGDSTRWASWLLLLLIMAEIICLIFKINFDLANWSGSVSAYAMGYSLPLGDIKVIFPLVMVICSLTLFFRTIGKYTKWLAIIIFASSLVTVHLLDPNILKELLRLGTMGYYYY